MKRPRPSFVHILLASLFCVCPLKARAAQQPNAADAAPQAPTQAGSTSPDTLVSLPVPRLVKFSATLLDEQERPLAGTVGVTFALYAEQTGGAALWVETQNVKPDAKGSYTVLLGAGSADGLPADLFASAEARWLGVQVGQQPERERILLVSVPYAFKAGDAETLGGKPASAFVTADELASLAESSAPTADNSKTGATSNAFSVVLRPRVFVSSVGSGLGLTGGPITTTGTLAIDPAVVPQLGAAQNTFAGSITAASLTGNGVALTNVNAAALNGLASSAFAQLAAPSNTFTGSVTAASFTGNGAGLTNITASNAATLNGLAPSAFAQLGAASNTFIGSLTAASLSGGSLALPSTTDSSNGVITLGAKPFAHNFGVNDTFVGVSAGNFTMTGAGNSAFGYNAFSANTSGNGNAAFGNFALNANQAGSNNSAFGFGALSANSIGNNNSAFGNNALTNSSAGQSNTAFGSEALTNTTGSNNAGFGFGALQSNTSGGQNVAIGQNALSGLATGGFNIALGYQSGNAFTGSESSNIDIGNPGVIGESNIIRIGNPGTQTATFLTGNVSIPGTLTMGGLITFASGQTFPGAGGGSGTVTSVASGLGLTGGPITSSGTLAINPAVVPQLGAASNTFTGSITASSFTGNGASLTNVNAAALNGLAPSAFAQLGASNAFTGNIIAPAFAGNGVALTNVNAASLNGLASSAFAQLAAASNSFTGSITAASFSGNGAGLTNITASNAATLNGLAASAFAQLGAASNTFSGSLTAASLSAGSVALPATTDSSNGVITLGAKPFAHNFGVNDTFVGTSAGNFATAGASNSGFGASALSSITSGTANAAFGNFALTANQGGTNNSAFGVDALSTNVSGNFNSAFGYLALSNNSAGQNNTAFGSEALTNTTGSNNAGFGFGALQSNTSGGQNVAIGQNALSGVATGGFNIALGYQSGNAFTGSESGNIDIGNPGVVGESNIIRIGSPGTQTATYLTGNVSIPGTLTMGGLVTFASGQTFPGAGGGSGTVTSVSSGLGLTGGPITSSGTLAINPAVVPQLGAASNTFTGSITASSFAGDGSHLNNVSASTLGGLPAGDYATTGSNDFSGTQFVTGDVNISGGNLDLPATTATSGVPSGGLITLGGGSFAHAFGGENTFLGSGAGNFTMTGFNNAATGYLALQSNTSGANNTADGSYSLQFNTTGSYNSANSHNALNANTTGNANTAVGSNSLQSNTTGNNNTAMGRLAGYTATAANANTTGSNNTFLGYQSGPGVSTEVDNATAIGANAAVNCSNCMVLGSVNGVNSATASTSVGIGTNTPAFNLDVHGTANVTGPLTMGGPITFASGQTFPGIAGGGTVTSLTAGTGLTGGTITTSGTLAIDPTVVPELGASSNTFTGNETVNGSITAGAMITAPAATITGSSGSALLNVSQSGIGPGILASSSSGSAALFALSTGGTAVQGTTSAANAVAATFNNSGGGSILVGANNGVTKFLVDGSGNVTASGSLIGSQLASTVATGTAPLTVASTTQVPNLNATLLGGMPVSSFVNTLGANTFAGTQSIMGTVQVDSNGLNAGSGFPGVAFGSGATGETISSDRTNQSANFQGIDFYTRSTPRLQIANNGNVGIGVNPGPQAYNLAVSTNSATGGAGAFINNNSSTPTEALHVQQFGLGDAATFFSDNASNTNAAVYISSGIQGPGLQVQQTGSGIAGNFSATNGDAVQSYTSSGTGAALHGVATGNGTGVLAETAGGGYALSAVIDNSGPVGTAVHATMPSGASGWYFYANTSDTDSLKFAVDNNGSAYVAGNLTVVGTVSKGGGSFKIDHPLDPADKYLYHSFVESPDMMNIYNGVIDLDLHGQAWVLLPEWFEALNRDFRYQLTSIASPQPNLYVSKEVTGNRFQIAGGKPHGKVSWQLTGIRHDAFANAHRIPVEEQKTGDEAGKYLYPELYGQPESLRVSNAKSTNHAPAASASPSSPH